MLSAVCKSPNYGNGIFAVPAGTQRVSFINKIARKCTKQGKGGWHQEVGISNALLEHDERERRTRKVKDLLLKRGSTRAFREICHGWLIERHRPTTSGGERHRVSTIMECL